jgi:hypothetical protein
MGSRPIKVSCGSKITVANTYLCCHLSPEYTTGVPLSTLEKSGSLADFSHHDSFAIEFDPIREQREGARFNDLVQGLAREFVFVGAFVELREAEALERRFRAVQQIVEWLVHLCTQLEFQIFAGMHICNTPGEAPA